jgi:hypothetical protein
MLTQNTHKYSKGGTCFTATFDFGEVYTTFDNLRPKLLWTTLLPAAKVIFFAGTALYYIKLIVHKVISVRLKLLLELVRYMGSGSFSYFLLIIL